MDSVDPADVGLRSDDNSWEVRDVGDETGGLLQQLRDLAVNVCEERTNTVVRRRTQSCRRAMIDVVAVSLMGRDAAR